MTRSGTIDTIRFAVSDADLERCYPVMAELRKSLGLAEFLERSKRQKELYGYDVVFVQDASSSEVKAVAGIRIAEWLAGGKYLEIEDLVTARDARSSGFGSELFDWIIEHARQQGCSQVRLVSLVCRFGAHRFYLRKRMNIEAHYFSMSI